MSQIIRMDSARRAKISGNVSTRLHFAGNRVSIEKVNASIALSGSLTLSVDGQTPMTLDLATDRYVGNSGGFDYLDIEVTGLPAGAAFLLVVGGV